MVGKNHPKLNLAGSSDPSEPFFSDSFFLFSNSSSNVLQMRCLIKLCISKYSAEAAFQCTVVDKSIYVLSIYMINIQYL